MMNSIVKSSLIVFVKILLMIGTFHLAYAIPPKFYWIVFPLVIGLFMIIDIGSDDDSSGDGPAGGPVDFSGNGDGNGNGDGGGD